mgnify:CR=1 FL=1
MSFHRKCWNVRTPRVSIGYRDSTTMPYCPSNAPKPNASSPPPTTPSSFRSNPLGTPVFDGATYA